VAVQKVRWDEGGTELANDYRVSYEKRNINHCLGMMCFVYKIIKLAVNRLQFVSDRMILYDNCYSE